MAKRIKVKGYKVNRQQKAISYTVKPHSKRKGKIGNNQYKKRK